MTVALLYERKLCGAPGPCGSVRRDRKSRALQGWGTNWMAFKFHNPDSCLQQDSVTVRAGSSTVRIICLSHCRRKLVALELRAYRHGIYTGRLRKMDSISYVYISWTVHIIWMIYIQFERGGPKFVNTTARALAYRIAVLQRQLRAEWPLCSARFFLRSSVH
jgi:hypothetical protein